MEKTSAMEHSSSAWGKFISHSSKNLHIELFGDNFKFDSGGILANFSLVEGGDLPFILMELQDGVVSVNGKDYKKTTHKHLLVRGGDELRFGSTLYTLNLQTARSTILAEEELALKEREIFDETLGKQIINPNDIVMSFKDFPFFLSDTTKSLIIASTRIHLDASFREIRKSAPKFVSESQRILLSGPAEIYQEALSKAIAKHFDARLLIVDLLSFPAETALKEARSSKRISKPKIVIDATSPKVGSRVSYWGGNRLGEPVDGSRGIVLICFEDNEFAKIGVKFEKPFPAGNDLGGLCDVGYGYFCRALVLCIVETPRERDDFHTKIMNRIFEFSCNQGEKGSLVVLVQNIEKAVVGEWHVSKDVIESLSPNIVIMASHTQQKTQPDQKEGKSNLLLTQEKRSRQPEGSNNSTALMNQIGGLFPNKLIIQLPQDHLSLSRLKEQLESHVSTKAESNAAIIRSVMNESAMDCLDFDTLCFNDLALTRENAQKIISYALSYPGNTLEDFQIILSPESVKYGYNILEKVQNPEKKLNSVKDIVFDNVFEEKLMVDVISPSDIGITFNDIGALQSVKDTLRELIMLPLQRPELFNKGQLAKPCKGILLFGPPGTGKTMLAKAVATETGANFINISLSSITSMWFGEAEKYVKAVFSLAHRIAPTIIFIDEVDSVLGKRGVGSFNETTYNKMKAEFFIHWDGLRTSEKTRVLLLAATNRPFDLDDAVIRRLPRRLLINLPDAPNREKILKVILADENLSPDIDLKEMADKTNGYSGSDLKNLCTAAAHCPIRELLEIEKKDGSLGESVRPLKMEDLVNALKEVRASIRLDSSLIDELLEWNGHFGEGGDASKEDRRPSYFI